MGAASSSSSRRRFSPLTVRLATAATAATALSSSWPPLAQSFSCASSSSLSHQKMMMHQHHRRPRYYDDRSLWFAQGATTSRPNNNNLGLSTTTRNNNGSRRSFFAISSLLYSNSEDDDDDDASNHEEAKKKDNDDDTVDTSSMVTLESLAKDIANSKYNQIVVLIGAGMSVSAGIPDFRTPGTGLYSKLEEYNLPYPEAIFELSYFKENPAPFVDVAQAIWPGQDNGPKPTIAHCFVALLDRHNLLQRVYTQNIDGLERFAGVSDSKLIECHGHFSSCSCIRYMCKARKNDKTLIQECQDTYVNENRVMECPDCGSYVKPDIVFFGEELPLIFMDHIDQDMEDCDLLIVMGTSLLVNPVASIPNWVGKDVPRILINRELVGSFGTEARRRRRRRALGDNNNNYPIRDVFAQGDCDDGARKICELAGDDWVKQLEEIHHDVRK